jgi:hypothetical protein
MRRLAGILVVAGLVMILSASGAWAGTCPVLAKQANELLSSTSTNTEKYAKAKALLDQWEAPHKAGNHAEATKVVQEALKILRTP